MEGYLSDYDFDRKNPYGHWFRSIARVGKMFRRRRLGVPHEIVLSAEGCALLSLEYWAVRGLPPELSGFPFE